MMRARSRRAVPRRRRARAPLSGAAALGRYPPHRDRRRRRACASSRQPDDDSLLSGIQVFVAAGLAHRDVRDQRRRRAARRMHPAHAGRRQRRGRRPCATRSPQTGGTINYTIEDTTVHYYVEARPERAPDVLRAVRAGARRARSVAGDGRRGAHGAAAARHRRRTQSAARRRRDVQGIVPRGAAARFPTTARVSSLAATRPGTLRAFYDADVSPRRAERQRRRQGHAARSRPRSATLRSRCRPDPRPPSPLKSQAAPADADAHHRASATLASRSSSSVSPRRRRATRDFGAMLLLESMLSGAFKRVERDDDLGRRTAGRRVLPVRQRAGQSGRLRQRRHRGRSRPRAARSSAGLEDARG